MTTKLNFEAGKVDPCLLIRTNEDGTVIVALYVDDCLCIGDLTLIKSLEKGLEEASLIIKVENDLSDYLSCEIKAG